MRLSGLLFRLIVFGTLWLAAAEAVADKSTFGELRLEPAGKVERDAGVWIDGQYVGYLRELDGRKALPLVPGRHTLAVKLAGYRDVDDSVLVEPGKRVEYTVAMAPSANVSYPDKAQTASLRLSVDPARAAVFVNGVYVGHVDRFDNRHGVRLAAGKYRLRVALPGYQAFETQVTLLAEQSYEVKTALKRASLDDQSEELLIGQAGN